MPPAIPREGTMLEIYQAMVDLENAALTAVDSNFTSRIWMPPSTEIDTLYPIAFRYPPKWKLNRRSMGESGSKPFLFTVELIILLGPSDNEFGDLTEQTARFIEPVLELYESHRSVSGTIQDIFDYEEAYMGDIPLNNIAYFGMVQGIIMEQRKHITSRM